jgi:thymidylate synthase (FAD)
MGATLIAWTIFDKQAFENATGFEADGYSGSDLAEAAGRLCYLSFNRPNAATATNQGYLANIIAQEHFSVLEHGTATFLFQGVSRNLTHELIRHRHFSYSEVSQRYVDVESFQVVQHPTIRGGIDEPTMRIQAHHAKGVYRDLVSNLMAEEDLSRKQAREAARGVLPGNLETKIVVTGNYRAWRHFINKRGSLYADAEIRELAVEVAKILQAHAPNAFQDLRFFEVDGRECVETRIKDVG